MNTDLTFRDPILESAFTAHHTASQQKLEIHFHYARAVAWVAVGVRTISIAASTGEVGRWLAAVITILGAITTVLPAFANRLPKPLYLRWRPSIIIADNIIQVVLGCYTHDTIYPKTGVTGIFKSAFVLLSGNGIAWLLFSGLWGTLIFKYMFPQQACLTLILLIYNRTLCRRSAALVHAYESIRRAAAQRLGLLVPGGLVKKVLFTAQHLLAIPCSSVAAMGAATCASGGGVCVAGDWVAACLGTAGCRAEGGSGAATAGGLCPLVDGERLCMIMQPTTQLLLGFFLPTIFVYAGELRARRAFARQVACSPAGRSTDWHWLDHTLRISLLDYFFFGLPVMACMYLFAVAAA